MLNRWSSLVGTGIGGHTKETINHIFRIKLWWVNPQQMWLMVSTADSNGRVSPPQVWQAPSTTCQKWPILKSVVSPLLNFDFPIEPMTMEEKGERVSQTNLTLYLSTGRRYIYDGAWPTLVMVGCSETEDLFLLHNDLRNRGIFLCTFCFWRTRTCL